MEALLVLVVLAIPGMILGGFIVSLVALSRAKTALRRIDGAEGMASIGPDHPLLQRLRIIEARVGKLQEAVAAGGMAPPPSAAEEPPPRAEAEVPKPQEIEAPPVVTPPPYIPDAPPPADTRPAAAPPPPKQPEPVVATAATRPPPPPLPEAPPRVVREPARTLPAIDWESWIGIRGAAVGGGVVLAIAVLVFFQYSIEQGWITPTLRVIMAMVAGLACIFGSEYLRKRRQPWAADALAGAGVVILYAATWAAQHLYQLIGAVPAFTLMVLITAACGMLALARQSLLIAVLGLLGGFATPLLVAPDADAPIPLFTYVLILDAGLLWLARRQRWPVLGLLCLIGTALHQAVWILDYMDARRLGIGLATLALFTLAFLLLGPRRDEDQEEPEHPIWRWCRSGGVLLPFVFALHMAGTTRLTEHLAPIAGLLLMLSVCAWWQARRQPEPLLAPAAASGTLGVVTLWFMTHKLSLPLLWEAVAVCAGLALAYTIMTELSREDDGWPSFSTGLLIVVCGFLALLVLASPTRSVPLLWPWLAGWSAQAALLIWHSRLEGKEPLQLAAGLGTAGGLLLFATSHYATPQYTHEPSLLLAVVVAIAIVLQVLGLLRQPQRWQRWANHTAAATSLALLVVALAPLHRADNQPALLLATASGLGLLAAFAAARLNAGPWFLAATLSTAAAHAIITGSCLGSWRSDASLDEALLVQALSVLAFTGWPLLSSRSFTGGRSAWWGAALAGPLWFLQLKAVYEARFGDDTIGIVPIVLAVLSLAAAMRARSLWERTSEVRSSALVWFLAVTLCLVSVAIPLQLEREWITIGWALNGLAVIALWSRLDHPGLKYFGVALLLVTTARLVLNPAVLGYYPRGGMPVLNWLLYTYLVPAAALLAAAVLLARRERQRLRPWEESMTSGKALAASCCGLAAVVVVFVWINLAIADYFGTTNALVLSFERMPARDATTSVAWAVYALVLLGIGVRLDSSVLRWVSLSLLVLTICKVFFHDLGKLEGLYRVYSLLGLGVAMIFVSIIYQRFVRRKEPEEEEEA